MSPRSPRFPGSLRVITLAAGAGLLAAAPLAAQGTTQAPDTVRIERPTVIIPAGSLPPAPVHRNQISVQPLAAVSFEVYQGEYERAISPSLTLGVGGSAWTHSDMHYRSGDLKLRFYPGARAFRGFSFGTSLGYTHITDDKAGYDYTTDSYAKTTTSGPSFGTLLEYGWLLGADQNFTVGLGVGAKVIFAKDTNPDGSGDTNLRYPTARFSIGWAF